MGDGQAAGDNSVSWRWAADWAKKRPAVLRMADRLGRGRGRFRMLDHVSRPRPAALSPDLSGWSGHALAAVWVGHATILLRIAGLTILTDPVFSHRVGVDLGLFTGGPRRLVAPALSMMQLPPIDVVLISHAHFDHLDRPTLARLDKRAAVITAHRTADLVRDLGFASVTELSWGEKTTIGSCTITAQQVEHWGARTFFDTYRGFNAYLLEGSGQRVLYGGDSAFYDGFRSIGESGGVDLAALGIGAYDPYLRAHANPEQAWAMGEMAGARHVLPMHHSTFRLSYEPDQEPMQRFLAAAGEHQHRVVIRNVGGMWVDSR
jgi:L-ascorbate metabolism protein UlaG (beta-lactamase superfamily)